MGKNLHPSVEQFKQFVKRHPKMIKEVRNGNKTWKEFYEDWYLFGEEDEIWEKYKGAKEEETSTSNGFMSKIVSSLKNMDVNNLEKHIASFQEAISAIQSVIGQFQGGNQNHSHTSAQNHHPFSFRKD
ncbi:putative PurR-regulated permease PerM [Anoxybacillus calidus]|jgi:Putative coat protein|uniref:Putative PurR-regulated permease PerM n=1 Tax=[Anoxybacillus] calidus TaxID=575178 RepID=A0A7W0BW57_9BACL|nr:YlbD family protein [Anoxybacillus calidus]MBA2870684.1 putative PurR-regulated permease PerM [Anoxybacillus calidus]